MFKFLGFKDIRFVSSQAIILFMISFVVLSFLLLFFLGLRPKL